jgi:hypothetical protein
VKSRKSETRKQAEQSRIWLAHLAHLIELELARALDGLAELLRHLPAVSPSTWKLEGSAPESQSVINYSGFRR